MKSLEVNERVVVAIDPIFDEEKGVEGLRKDFFTTLDIFAGFEVVIKVNSILRVLGYELIEEIHKRNLQCFADLKLNDIPNTLKNDGEALAYYRPEIVTVMASTGIEGMKSLKSTLQESEILGVTVLTSFNDTDSQEMYGDSANKVVRRLAHIAKDAGLDGFVASPHELSFLRENKEFETLSLVTPGVRPEWSAVEGDDQSRVMTPGDAFRAGADRIVIGRPITQAQDRREALERTLEEVANALA